MTYLLMIFQINSWYFPKYGGNSLKNKAALLYFDETQNVNVKPGLSFFNGAMSVIQELTLDLKLTMIIPPFNHWTKIRQMDQ